MDTPIKPPMGPQTLNPAQMRADAISKAAEERLESTSQKLLDVIGEEKVTMAELPLIIDKITKRVNARINGAEIRDITNLGNKDDK